MIPKFEHVKITKGLGFATKKCPNANEVELRIAQYAQPALLDIRPEAMGQLEFAPWSVQASESTSMRFSITIPHP